MTRPAAGSTTELGRVLTGALWSATTLLSGIVVGLPLTVILVRTMSQPAYGALTLGSSIIGIVAAVGGLGLAAGVARQASFRLARDEHDAAADVVHSGLRIAAVASVALVAACAVALVALEAVDTLRPAVPVVAIMAPLIAVGPFQAVASGYLQAVRRPRRAEGARLVGAVVGFALALAFILAGWRGAVPQGLARTIAGVLSAVILLLALRALRRRTPAAAGVVEAPAEPSSGALPWRALLAFSLPLLFTSIMWAGISQLDIVVLGAYRGADAAAMYGPVTRLVEWPVTVFTLAGAYLLPGLTAAIARDDPSAVRRLYHATSRWGLAIAAPLIAIVVATPGAALTVLYGPGYAGMATVARILAIGSIVHVMLGFNGLVLEAYGRPRQVATRAAIGLVANVVACIALIPTLGPAGAAWATTIAFIVVNAANSWFLLRRYGVAPWDARLGASVGAIALAVVVAWWAASFVEGGFARCVIAGAIGAIAGVGAAWLAGDGDERRELRMLARGRRGSSSGPVDASGSRGSGA